MNAAAPPGDPGEVITFYSYKGGTGRTMALANCAVLLARGHVAPLGGTARPRRVLAVDWDLEAPGLHRYFETMLAPEERAALEARPGLVEWMTTIDADTGDWAVTDPDEGWARSLDLLNSVGLDDYVTPTRVEGVHLMKAGQLGPDYRGRVNALKWHALFERAAGLFPALAHFLCQCYDYVLIDSRTGITDTGGICTALLPQRLVVVFTPNLQSLTGVEAVVRQAVEYRRRSGDLRPLSVFPLPSRIELARPDLIAWWRSGGKAPVAHAAEDWRGYQPIFEALFAETFGVTPCDLSGYFREVQLQHVPDYAFGEPLAVEIEHDDRLLLRASYEAFAMRLISLAGPWEDPATVEAARQVEARVREAGAQLDAGDLGAAVSTLTLAQGVWRERGVAPLALAEAMARLAEAHAAAGNGTSAAAWQMHAANVAAAALGEDHPGHADYLVTLAGYQRTIGETMNAADTLRHAIRLRTAALGDDHPTLAAPQAVLGEILVDTGQLAEGLELMRRGFEMLRADLGDHHPDLVPAKQRLEAVAERVQRQLEQPADGGGAGSGVGKGVDEATRETLRRVDQTIVLSPGALQVAGDNNVVLYLDRAARGSERKRVESLFTDYLRQVRERLTGLPLGAVSGRGAGREDVPLVAVYTALNVTATVVVPTRGGKDDPRARGSESTRMLLPPGMDEGMPGREGIAGVQGLRGDPGYLKRLLTRVEREARESRTDDWDRARSEMLAGGREDFSRPVTAVEAAAAARRLVLLGPAGSGKSTFVKYMALCMAGELMNSATVNLAVLNGLAPGTPPPPAEDLSWPHGALLPIVVELRRFVASAQFPGAHDAGEAGHLLGYLERREPDPLDAEFARHLRDYLMGGKAILILDGLDEVPQAEACRTRLKQVIAGFARRYPECRIVVTSRPYAYVPGSPWRLDDGVALGEGGVGDDGFVEATLAPFDDDQIARFVDGWYRKLAPRYGLSPGDAGGRAERLMEQLGSQAYLRPLVVQPLMLTMIADLHASLGGNLPLARVDLYARSVELLLDRWNEARAVEGIGLLSAELGMEVKDIRAALEELAYTVHKRGAEAQGAAGADIDRKDLWAALSQHRPEGGGRPIDEDWIMDLLHQRSGILVGESPTLYRFPHRTYQEYLAAQHLTRLDFPEAVSEAIEADPALWREVALLTAASVAGVPYTIWGLLERWVPGAPPAGAGDIGRDDVGWWLALYAGLAVNESRLAERIARQHQPKLERIRLWLRRTLELGALPPADRAEAGRVLAVLGDDRPGVGLRADGLPDLDWCEVPAGAFTMGSKRFEDEKPVRKETVAAFSIARYPVTHAQFQAFVEDPGGYADGRWWQRGLARREADPADAFWPIANHPRERVSWYEAVAFCRWLTDRLSGSGAIPSGMEIRLPTEQEWEKAARGTDGREWPWGSEWDDTLANTREGDLGRTTPVGMYPDGASPYGVLDMAGNVWEWCLNEYGKPANAGTTGDRPRVLRGGSWFSSQICARAAYRYNLHPNIRYYFVGFRCVLGSPISG